MTKELHLRVHIASLVEHICEKVRVRTPSLGQLSVIELLTLDTFLSFHVLVIIFLSHVIYLNFVHYRVLFRTCCCIGFHDPDFFRISFHLCFFVSGKTSS